MNYLLDTCVLSELRKPQPDAGVVAWVSGTDENRLFVSVLSLGEVQKGIAKLAKGRRKNAFQHWLEHDLKARFGERILSLDLDMALEWGLLGAVSEDEGRPAPVIDSLLAVTAISHNLTLVTRNEKDLVGCPVKLLNPWNEG
ncbi:MAG: type II toxin-antitoxin system VapC family toxin [Gammaproteobacteria bacterium]|nr:type II toxin-antitoxin system VapC family toxin [Gammaproteobacteria bacterium]